VNLKRRTRLFFDEQRQVGDLERQILSYRTFIKLLFSQPQPDRPV